MGLLQVLRGLLPQRFTPEALDALKAANPRTVLLDVREPGEFAEGHIPGSVLVPMTKVPHHATMIAEAGVPIVLVCRSGARASACRGVLQHGGAREVHVLSGGVHSWRRAGRQLRTGSKSPSLSQALRAR